MTVIVTRHRVLGGTNYHLALATQHHALGTMYTLNEQRDINYL